MDIEISIESLVPLAYKAFIKEQIADNDNQD